MRTSLQTNKKVETGLILRKDTMLSKVQRFLNTILYKEEISILQKIEKYLIKTHRPIGNVVIPKEIHKVNNTTNSK